MSSKSAATKIERELHPIDNVQWVHVNSLSSNDYNPNRVASPEMDLLKTSISEDGFTQPIVVCNGEIVDGFHRWTVAKDLGMDLVPVVELTKHKEHRMLSTIRHNRARGTHAVLKMANIVSALMESGVDEKELIARLGMEQEEVQRLSDKAGMPDVSGKGFGKSWSPKDAG